MMSVATEATMKTATANATTTHAATCSLPPGTARIRRWRAVALLLSLSAGLTGGCSSDGGAGGGDEADAGMLDIGPAADPTCPDGCPRARSWVIDRIELAPVDEEGRAAGFNLDGLVSDGTKPEDCGFDDVVGFDGSEGIDNQFSKVLNLLPPQVGGILPDAIDTAVSAGGLSMIAHFETADGAPLDADLGNVARMRILQGDGPPLLTTDGELLADQTFPLSGDPVLADTTELTVQADGSVVSGAFDLDFRMLFISTPLQADLRHSRIRMTPDGKGGFDGEIGGIVSIADTMVLVSNLGGDDESLGATLENLIPVFAESSLQSDGACDGLSMGLRIHAIPVYVLNPPD